MTANGVQRNFEGNKFRDVLVVVHSNENRSTVTITVHLGN